MYLLCDSNTLFCTVVKGLLYVFRIALSTPVFAYDIDMLPFIPNPNHDETCMIDFHHTDYLELLLAVLIHRMEWFVYTLNANKIKIRSEAVETDESKHYAQYIKANLQHSWRRYERYSAM